jgi:hypothetical protein
LNSRVNCLLSMTHLLLHKTPNLVSSEPGAAQSASQEQIACRFRAVDMQALW